MKKVLLIIAMITLSVVATNAQVAIGIKAGLNGASVSNVKSNNNTNGVTEKSKIKLGGQFGAYANIKFGDLLGFQPEVLFSMKGYRYESTSANSSVKQSVTLNYIDIPLQLRVNPTKSFYILVGPYIGILAGASATTESTTTVPFFGTTTQTSKSSSTNGLKPMDFGAVAAIGLKAENGFTMGLNYSRGFVTIYENDSNSANVNSVFALFVGFEFGGK
ncbi:MAG: porin family protein [Bacteroidota bacterium]